MKKTPLSDARPRVAQAAAAASSFSSRRSRAATALLAAFALALSTVAWFSLIFSGSSTSHHLHQISHRDGGGGSPTPTFSSSSFSSASTSSLSAHNRSLTELNSISSGDRDRTLTLDRNHTLTLRHIVVGIAGSSKLWNKRKEYVKLWWRSDVLRGHVWLEEELPRNDSDVNLPEIMVSEDTSRFRYTNPTGHPSGLRISRIIGECFRLNMPDVRWFVLGDDDTIFNVDNLLDVLSKYDDSEMVYIGSPSESHSANNYFSHSMAYGGGGIAISYPLAKALSVIQDQCLERYPKLYGSDDRLHACISELGVPLTREKGFHQWDIRGDAFGLLSSHPIAPFISIHHLDAVDPLYPGLSSLDSLKLFTKAMTVDPRSFLQRAICYDHDQSLTFSVSLGYVVQVFPNILNPRDLERSELTFSAWNWIRHRNEFDFDTRDPFRSICKKPTLFFLRDVERRGVGTLGKYVRAGGRDDIKRRVFCFPHTPPLRFVQEIWVMGHPLNKNWHLAPRRLCCGLNGTSSGILRLNVGKCEK